MRAYYAGRGSNAREATFRDSIHPVIARERRRFLLDYLQTQGFALKEYAQDRTTPARHI